MKLYQMALDRGITIGPGCMFSISPDNYQNYIRLNYSSPWSSELEQAIITVGKLAATCAR
jgi:DNA-binding transcriptional MocR family regulator